MAAEAPREAVWPEGAGAEAGFVRAVLSLLEKPDTTVRFFERGDYYSVHGADARLASRELFRTRAVIRQLAGAPGACGAGAAGRPSGYSRQGNGRGGAVLCCVCSHVGARVWRLRGACSRKHGSVCG